MSHLSLNRNQPHIPVRACEINYVSESCIDYCGLRSRYDIGCLRVWSSRKSAGRSTIMRSVTRRVWVKRREGARIANEILAV